MAKTNFTKPFNDVQLILSDSYVPGSGVLRVTDLSLVPSDYPTTADPLRLTIFRVRDGAKSCLEFTGRSGNTLTGGTIQENRVDIPFDKGDVAQIHPSAGYFWDIHNAINTLEEQGLAFPDLTANQVLAGPTSGPPAQVAARALVAADIPNIPESKVTNLISDLSAKAPLDSAVLIGTPIAPTAAQGTNTDQIATTAFVQENVPVASVFGRIGAVAATGGDYTVDQVTGAAPLNNPVFTGTPEAPTPASNDNSTKVATTAYVKAQSYLTTGPVTSVFTRTGAILAQTGDYSVDQITGAAPLASPAFTGTPTAPSPALNDNSTKLATTSYVKNQNYITTASFPVTKVFDRTGVIDAQAGDYDYTKVTGAAPLASPAFTGVPTAPTATLSDNSTTVATTAFVKGQGYQTTIPVTSVFGRTGAIVKAGGDYAVGDVTGAAPLASPTFTGTPAAPTATLSDNSTKIATTAFVKGQGYVTGNAVSSVFGRTGSVVATSGDYSVSQVTGAAPLESPALTGTPTAPTQSSTDNSTAIATTAYVQSHGYISNSGLKVTSVYGRIGDVVAMTGDYTVSQVTGAAPTASPTFTGTPVAPTVIVSDNSAKIATTAYVKSQLYATADSPALTGVPTAPTPSTPDSSAKIATTAYVQNQGYVTSTSAPVTSVFTRTGAVVATSGDYSVSQVTGAAPLASPTFTGTVTTAGVSIGDGSDIALGTSSGTKIGTSTSQKLGFFNSAPIVKPTGNIITALGNLGLVGSGTIAESDITSLTSDLALKAPLASPTFTGTPAAPTPSAGDNSTKIATTAWVQTFGQLLAASLCGGRLTIISGDPYGSSASTSQQGSTLYFTPVGQNGAIGLYNGSSWDIFPLTEISISVPTSGYMWDVYVYNNSGTPALEFSAAWSASGVGTGAAGTRTDALGSQDGIYVKGSDHTRRYIGSIWSQPGGVSDCSGGNGVIGARLVWNFYNRIKKYIYINYEYNTSWTPDGLSTFRAVKGNTSQLAYVVCGVRGELFDAHVYLNYASHASTPAFVATGIGYDTFTGWTGILGAGTPPVGGSNTALHGSISYPPDIGLHYFTWEEYSTAAVGTFTNSGSQDGVLGFYNC